MRERCIYEGKEKAPIAGGLEFGALGEIRTPYPLVRRQVGGIQFFHYWSTGYKAYPVSLFEQHPVCNPLFCLVSLRSNEMNFSTDLVENKHRNATTKDDLLIGFSSRKCS